MLAFEYSQRFAEVDRNGQAGGNGEELLHIASIGLEQLSSELFPVDVAQWEGVFGCSEHQDVVMPITYERIAHDVVGAGEIKTCEMLKRDHERR